MRAARIAAVVAVLAVATAAAGGGAAPAARTPATAAGDPGPVEVVRAFYGRDSIRAYEFYTARLRELFEAEERDAGGEVGRLDFAFYMNGQDASDGWERTLAYELVRRGERDATVRVTFVSFKESQELRYTLVREKGRWLIDDARSVGREKWVLSEILKGGN